jgi:hypothetical protein
MDSKVSAKPQHRRHVPKLSRAKIWRSGSVWPLLAQHPKIQIEAQNQPKPPDSGVSPAGAYVTGIDPHYETKPDKPIVLVDLSTVKTRFTLSLPTQKPL